MCPKADTNVKSDKHPYHADHNHRRLRAGMPMKDKDKKGVEGDRLYTDSENPVRLGDNA